MAGVFNILQTQSQSEALHQVEAQRLVAQLANFRTLRAKEKHLRARVAYLEKQAARQGPLHREVNLALSLKGEQAQLQSLRDELAAQEKELEGQENLPVDETVQLKARRLDERISDLQARREQVLLHQSNVHFLEERLAQLGQDARLDFVNELKLSQEELKTVQASLESVQTHLFVEWQLTPADIPRLDEMDEKQIEKFAYEVVIKRETRSREGVMRCMAEGVKRLEEIVTPLLQELRASAYSSGKITSPSLDSGFAGIRLVRVDSRVSSQVPQSGGPISNPEWKSEGDVYWGISTPGTFAGVAVVVEFNQEGRPKGFECLLRGNDSKIGNRASAGLDRDSLRDALKRLLAVRKRPWEFWKSSPNLPKNWN